MTQRPASPLSALDADSIADSYLVGSEAGGLLYASGPSPQQAADAVSAAAAAAVTAVAAPITTAVASATAAATATATATATVTSAAPPAAPETLTAKQPGLLAATMLAVLTRYNPPLIAMLAYIHRRTRTDRRHDTDRFLEEMRVSVNTVMAAPALASLPLLAGSGSAAACPLMTTPPPLASAGSGAGIASTHAFRANPRKPRKTN